MRNDGVVRNDQREGGSVPADADSPLPVGTYTYPNGSEHRVTLASAAADVGLPPHEVVTICWQGMVDIADDTHVDLQFVRACVDYWRRHGKAP
jgi:hypothetical protein